MEAVAGIIVLVISLPCWAGQVISWLAPERAEQWRLTEAQDSVEPVYHADIRGEAVWDALTLWTMPVTGVLLIVGVDWWPAVGLIAGGMYVYFAGRGIVTRRFITHRGFRVGDPAYLPTAYGALATWGLLGLIVVISALATGL